MMRVHPIGSIQYDIQCQTYTLRIQIIIINKKYPGQEIPQNRINKQNTVHKAQQEYNHKSQTYNTLMHLRQLSSVDQGINVSAMGHVNSSVSAAGIKRKDKDRQYLLSKENQSKHMNAIRPYKDKQKEKKISKKQSQKFMPHTQHNNNNNISYINSSHIANGSILTQNNQEGHTGATGWTKQKQKKPGQSQSLKKLPQQKQKQRQKQKLHNPTLQQLYTELTTLKSQYRILKQSYASIQQHNTSLTQRSATEQSTIQQLTRQLQLYRKEEQKLKNNVQFLEHETERIKKECLRMIETQKFKNRKLEEIIQEKELMIAYLRAQLGVLSGSQADGVFFQNTTPTYLKPLPTLQNMPQKFNAPTSNMMNDQNINKSVINQSVISSIHNYSGIEQMTDFGLAQPSVLDLPRQINNNSVNGRLHENGNKSNVNGVKNDRYRSGNSRLRSITQQQPPPIPSTAQPQNPINTSFPTPIIPKPPIAPNPAQINPSVTPVSRPKRQYIFSQQNQSSLISDSLSFSYEKSRESLGEIDGMGDGLRDGGEPGEVYNPLTDNISMCSNSMIDSVSNPSILTFTKKDIYVLQDDHHKQQQAKPKQYNEQCHSQQQQLSSKNSKESNRNKSKNSYCINPINDKGNIFIAQYQNYSNSIGLKDKEKVNLRKQKHNQMQKQKPKQKQIDRPKNRAKKSQSVRNKQSKDSKDTNTVHTKRNNRSLTTKTPLQSNSIINKSELHQQSSLINKPCLHSQSSTTNKNKSSIISNNKKQYQNKRQKWQQKRKQIINKQIKDINLFQGSQNQVQPEFGQVQHYQVENGSASWRGNQENEDDICHSSIQNNNRTQQDQAQSGSQYSQHHQSDTSSQSEKSSDQQQPSNLVSPIFPNTIALQKNNYTGQQDLLTFQNRMNLNVSDNTQKSLMKIIEQNIKLNANKDKQKVKDKAKGKSKGFRKNKSGYKQKQKQGIIIGSNQKQKQSKGQKQKLLIFEQHRQTRQKKQASKNKLLTKRLQLYTPDQINGNGSIMEGKQSSGSMSGDVMGSAPVSTEARRRVYQTINVNGAGSRIRVEREEQREDKYEKSQKNWSKKINRKRKSQECGGSIIKK